MESVYQALTEGLRAIGGGEVKVYRRRVGLEEGMESGFSVITNREKKDSKAVKT